MSTTEVIQISTLKRNLSFLILGQKGGQNRVQILELLRVRPYNINQMAEVLDLNYRTIKHHINLLLKFQLISSSKTGGYGDVFFLSPDLEGNMHVYDSIVQKMDCVKKLADFTDSPLFFKNVLRHTYEGVIIVDFEWDVYFWNKSASRIFGHTEEEILHGPLEIFSDDRALAEIRKKLAKVKRLDDLTVIGKKKTGEPLDISTTIDPISDGGNKVIGYSILIRDITEKKRIEAELTRKRRALEIIIENTGSGIAYLDANFDFLIVNSAYVKGSGHKKEDIIGKNHFSLFPNKENEDIFKKVRDTGKQMEVFDKPYEFLDQPKRGITYWNWSLVPVKDDSGTVVSLVLTLKETTKNVKARLKGKTRK
jgi:PAS domain S-box-containing protein